jgi:hypothetical protein
MRAFVPPIYGKPNDYGLLGGCTEIVTVTDPHELNGTDLLSVTCGAVHQWQDCPDPGSTFTNPPAKLFDRPKTCTFNPITLTAGVECSTFGLSFEEANQRALDQLALGEQTALEDFFMRHWLAVNAVDITPASGALHIVNGIGALESKLAETYGGEGVLHIMAGASSLLSMHTIVDFARGTDSPTTLMGNCIVLGAGYVANVGPNPTPGGPPVPAPAGEAWLYITPPVRVRRDQPQLVTTNEQQQVAHRTNDRRALAETTMVPEVACCEAWAVRVTLSACC